MRRDIDDYSNLEIAALSQFLQVSLLEGDSPEVLKSLLPNINDLMGGLDFVLIQDILRTVGSELRLYALPIAPFQRRIAETIKAFLPNTDEQTYPFYLKITIGGDAGLSLHLRRLGITPESNTANLRNTGLLTVVERPTQKQLAAAFYN